MGNTQLFIGNRYELIEKIGQGGMGVVYHAYDRLMRQPVALKQLMVSANDLVFNSISENEDSHLSIASEFQILASLRHPHIISVLDYGFDAQRRPFFTMSLLEETVSLRTAAHRRDSLGKIDLFLQVLQAVAYLHQRGIVHRDLKPANILVVQGEIIKVLDFGLAMHPDNADDMAGTLAYMAPEILQGETILPAADLYAIGVMLYESFVGHHPFNTRNNIQLMHDIVFKEPDLSPLREALSAEDDIAYPVESIDEGKFVDVLNTTRTVEEAPQNKTVSSDAPLVHAVPQNIYDVVAKLLRKDPAHRYQQAHHVLADLFRVTNQPVPEESRAIRESFLQAAKFVGRKDEIKRLQKALHHALMNRGSIWLVGGESGVGKSRLIEELRTYSLVRGAIVVRGQGVEGGGLPYHLWREVLPPLLLNTQLSDLEAGILSEIIPSLARLLDRVIGEPPEAQGKEWQERLLFTIQDILKRQSQPVVILLEDLQWAIDSLLPVKQLERIIKRLPVLVVGTYRNDERPDLPSEFPTAQVIELNRLADTEITELAQSMIGQVEQEASVLDLIKRETDGNTFMMIEVVRVLAEEVRQLNQIGDNTLPAKALFGGIQTIVKHRLKRLSVEAQQILELAAVMGRQIDEALLSYIDPTIDLATWLYACENANILSAQGDIWRFAHDMFRETILKDLDTATRIQLERTVASAIEEIYGTADTNADILLEHWRHAHDYQKAAHYAMLAGKRHANLGGYRQAKDLLEEGLELLKTQPDADEQRMIILRQLGHTVYHLNDYELANQYLEDSLEIAQQRQDHATIAKSLLGISMILAQSGQYAEAIEYATECYTHAQTANKKRIESDTLAHLGVIAFRQGYYDQAQDYHLQSLVLCEDANYTGGIAASLNNLGMLASRQGKYAQATDYYERSLKLCREIGNRFKISVCLNNLGIIYEREGNYEKTLEYYRESLALKEDIGDQKGRAVTLHNLGIIMRSQQEYTEAKTYIEQSLGISEEINFGILSIYNYSFLTMILLKRAEQQEAQQTLQKGLALCEIIDATAGHLIMLVAAIHSRIDEENYADALAWVQLALTHASTSQEIRDEIEQLKPLLMPHLGDIMWATLETEQSSLLLNEVLHSLLDELI